MKSKKGFTIVELVIVIAVIAILAAVLIPTFSNIIKKANTSTDTQLVKNLNDAVAMGLAEEGKSDKASTAYEAMQYAEAGGYDVAKIVAKSDYNIAWSVDTGNFVLIDTDEDNPKAIYPTTSGTEEIKVKDNEVNYFVIVSSMDDVPTGYSVYAGVKWEGGATIDINGVGFDAGKNTDITSVNYTNTTGTAQKVIIRTNSAETNLNINAADDTASHYGLAGNIEIEHIADSTWNEFGRVAGVCSIADGHVEIMNSGEITSIAVVASNVSDVKIDTTGAGTVGVVFVANETAKNTLQTSGNSGVNQWVYDYKDDNGNSITDAAKILEKIESIANDSLLYIKETNIYYDDFHEAFAAAENGQTLVLIRDTAVQYKNGAFIAISSGKNYTFDLNGHILYGIADNSASAKLIDNAGTLTIKDSTDSNKDGSGSGKITNNASTSAKNNGTASVYEFATSTINNTGTIILESGTVESTTKDGASYAIDSTGNVTMNGGKLLCIDGDSAMRVNASGKTNATFTMNTGIIEAQNAWGVLHFYSRENGIGNVYLNGGAIKYENLSAYPIVIGSSDSANANFNGVLKLSGVKIDGVVALRANTSDSYLDIDSSKYTSSEVSGNLAYAPRKYIEVKNK